MKDWKTRHKLLFGIGVVVGAALIAIGYQADRLLRMGAGYKAKIACSEIFVADRDETDVLATEFVGMPAAMDYVKARVEMRAQSVRAAGPFGLGGVRAVYRPGYGCTLASGGRIAALPEPVRLERAAPWREAPPVSGKALMHVDYGALDSALMGAFEDKTIGHRSVVVVVDGKIVDEMYADGFDASTPFQSWSMAKSVTATLVGAAVLHGYVDINDRAPVPEWADEAEKSRITWDDLLRMQSGLSFVEDYTDPHSDVNRMLFERADAGGAAVRSPVAHGPGEVWYYSSGTSNLIARTLRQVLDKHGLELDAFAREAILDPVGAASVILEPDASGTLVGSSFVYATARDWARLGQLYLQGGVWNGERLLPEGWSDYVREPTFASDGQYGAQFWLNRDGENGGEDGREEARERFFPGVPEEMYFFAGHEGQYVFIVPDKNMVIVRTGLTRGRPAMPLVAPMVADIYTAIGQPDSSMAEALQ